MISSSSPGRRHNYETARSTNKVSGITLVFLGIAAILIISSVFPTPAAAYILMPRLFEKSRLLRLVPDVATAVVPADDDDDGAGINNALKRHPIARPLTRTSADHPLMASSVGPGRRTASSCASADDGHQHHVQHYHHQHRSNQQMSQNKQRQQQQQQQQSSPCSATNIGRQQHRVPAEIHPEDDVDNSRLGEDERKLVAEEGLQQLMMGDEDSSSSTRRLSTGSSSSSSSASLIGPEPREAVATVEDIRDPSVSSQFEPGTQPAFSQSDSTIIDMVPPTLQRRTMLYDPATLDPAGRAFMEGCGSPEECDIRFSNYLGILLNMMTNGKRK